VGHGHHPPMSSASLGSTSMSMAFMRPSCRGRGGGTNDGQRTAQGKRAAEGATAWSPSQQQYACLAEGTRQRPRWGRRERSRGPVCTPGRRGGGGGHTVLAAAHADGLQGRDHERACEPLVTARSNPAACPGGRCANRWMCFKRVTSSGRPGVLEYCSAALQGVGARKSAGKAHEARVHVGARLGG
jgi:hypothetical protein